MVYNLLAISGGFKGVNLHTVLLAGSQSQKSEMCKTEAVNTLTGSNVNISLTYEN